MKTSYTKFVHNSNNHNKRYSHQNFRYKRNHKNNQKKIASNEIDLQLATEIKKQLEHKVVNTDMKITIIAVSKDLYKLNITINSTHTDAIEIIEKAIGSKSMPKNK